MWARPLNQIPCLFSPCRFEFWFSWENICIPMVRSYYWIRLPFKIIPPSSFIMSIFTHYDTCSYRDKQVFILFRYRCSLKLSSNFTFKVSLVWFLIIIQWQNYSKHWLGYLLLSWVDTTHWWHNPSLFNERLFLILPAREFRCYTKENNFSDWHCGLVLCWPTIWVWN